MNVHGASFRLVLILFGLLLTGDHQRVLRDRNINIILIDAGKFRDDRDGVVARIHIHTRLNIPIGSKKARHVKAV